MGRPRKPNALSNAEKCKRYRASQTPEMIFKRKENDRLRKMKYRQNLKKEENKKAYEALKQRDNERKHKARENAPPPGTPFNNKQTKARLLNKTKASLPKDRSQVAEIVSEIVKDMTPTKKKMVVSQLRCTPTTNPALGRPLSLDEERTAFILSVLEREDVSYTMPGKKDQVYVGKDSEGNSSYKTKHYLLWTISDVLGIMNAEDSDSYFMKFGEKLKFSTLYRFVKTVKHMYFQKNIPHQSCLCDKCENLELLAEAINRHVPSMKLPTNCQDLLSTEIDLESVNNTEEISVYQWKKSASNKYPEKTSEMLTGPECKEKITGQLADVKQHDFLKRNQHAVFRKQKENLKENEILIHVDFSE